MARFVFGVIPEPPESTRSVLAYQGEGTVAMKGSGKHALECGGCGSTLFKGWDPKIEFRNVVIRCNGCGAFNDSDAGRSTTRTRSTRRNV